MLLLDECVTDPLSSIFGAETVSGNPRHPNQGLLIQIINILVGSRSKETISNVANRPFDASLQESDRLQAIRLVRCDNGIG